MDIEVGQTINSTEMYKVFYNAPQFFIDAMINNGERKSPKIVTLIVAYSFMILFGATGNVLVIFAALKKKSMRSVRHIFICNLAVSDLTLCTFAMPFTLTEVVTLYWPFGSGTSFLCKLSSCIPTLCVYVSSFSITAIAVDRYFLIVHPTYNALTKKRALILILCIWVLSFIFALPMYLYRDLSTAGIKFVNTNSSVYIELNQCGETFSVSITYSMVTIIFQCILPIITVSIAYSKIAIQLKSRMNSLSHMTIDKKKLSNEDMRLKKTNQLLVSITFVFAMSWLPLNIFLCVDDYMSQAISRDRNNITFPICHLISMSSACSNPLLYGWLNENFRKEFLEILSCFRKQNTTEDANIIYTEKRPSYRRAVEKRNLTPIIIYTKATSTPISSDNQIMKIETMDISLSGPSTIIPMSPSPSMGSI
ncbi:neuropeptide F receptor-like [Artemia franciscana]|uniref:G-protein coupled receptors family 1 profile domain-containing protein n=1 Tax=Artemia franciscana TaxID=6661 RepID=A0AA88HKS9_ARTSF|nr:hypothetical protein QYM36_011661 [Artemia franciscana]